MPPRFAAPFLPVLLGVCVFIPAGCNNNDVLDVGLTIDSLQQTGREVTVTATVRNRGTVPVRYWACPGTSNPWARIVNEQGVEYFLDYSCVAIGAPCTQETLDPGKTLSRTIHFRGSAWDPQGTAKDCIPTCLPFGHYFATFGFTYSTAKGSGEPLNRSIAFDWPKGSVDLVPTGTWGGQGMEVTAEDCGGSFQLDCGLGELSEPLILDAEGAFQGTGAISYGPVPLEYQQPMSYEGTVDSGTMTLTLYLFSGDVSYHLGPYQLTFGEKGVLQFCR